MKIFLYCTVLLELEASLPQRLQRAVFLMILLQKLGMLKKMLQSCIWQPNKTKLGTELII